jgi:enoyl-CoA hydratase/carnithine racemase
MLGQPFGATLAAEIGLVTEVVPDARVLDTAIETASKLAAKPPAALQACKRLIKRHPRKQLDEAIRVENEEFAARVRSAEAKEAFKAFVEKRAPDFTKAQRV